MKSLLLRAGCIPRPLLQGGKGFWSEQGQRDGDCAKGSPGPVHYSSLLHHSVKTGANLESCKDTPPTQSTQVQDLCPLLLPSAHPPCFPNPKSVLCFTGKLIEDCVETESFPKNE